MTRLVIALALLILAALLAGLAVILARPRWRWEPVAPGPRNPLMWYGDAAHVWGAEGRGSATGGNIPPRLPSCRRCPSLGHTTAWHEAHWSWSRSSPEPDSGTTRADNGTDPRLLGV